MGITNDNKAKKADKTALVSRVEGGPVTEGRGESREEIMESQNTSGQGRGRGSSSGNKLKSLREFTLILCPCVFCLHVCLCITCVPSALGGHWIPWNTGVTDGCELLCVCWKLNLGPLQELLTDESSL